MNWNDLLAEKRVAAEPASREEIAELREVVRRNLADAVLPGLSADGQFSMAYNAARTLATCAVRACGYRVRTVGGAHYNTFVALEAALGQPFAGLAAYFDVCRVKRNDLSYDAADVVTETEARELVRRVQRFEADLASWFHAQHPGLWQ